MGADMRLPDPGIQAGIVKVRTVKMVLIFDAHNSIEAFHTKSNKFVYVLILGSINYLICS
jgi:hypothetical protein